MHYNVNIPEDKGKVVSFFSLFLAVKQNAKKPNGVCLHQSGLAVLVIQTNGIINNHHWDTANNTGRLRALTHI